MTHANDPLMNLMGSIIGTAISSGAVGRGRNTGMNAGDLLGAFSTFADKVGETNNARKETVNDSRANSEKTAPKTATSEPKPSAKPEPSIFSTVGNFLGTAESKVTRGFEELFNPRTQETVFVDRPTGETPPFDVILGEESVEFRFAVAGLKAEHVNADIQDDKLLISIHVPSEPLTGAREYAVREIWSGHFTEAFTIPTEDNNGRKEIDENNVTAKVKDGLFTVVVPFRKRSSTKIKIS